MNIVFFQGLVVMLLGVHCFAQNDTQMLRSIYNACKGPSWQPPSGHIRSIGWMDGYNGCQWPGVNCVNLSVDELNLRMYGLNCQGSPTVPSFSFPNVRLIDAGFNAIGLPFHLLFQDSAPALGYLKIGNSNLNGNLPTFLTSSRLLELSASENQIVGTLPETWGGSFPKIQQINLARNVLTGTLPISWGNFVKLESLDLSSNGFVGTVPKNWESMTSLKKLYLSGNRLSGMPPTWMLAVPDVVISGNNWEWDCESNYKGKWDSKVGYNVCDPKGEKKLLLEIVIPVVVGACVLIGIGVYCCCCRKKASPVADARECENGPSAGSAPNDLPVMDLTGTDNTQASTEVVMRVRVPLGQPVPQST
eukprot:PhF_6_TR11296/c0_g1_i2/m.18231